VPEPKLAKEGNLRVAGLPCTGYPADPDAIHAQVLALLAGSQAKPYGPVMLWFVHGPEETPSSQWDCLVGTSITGLPPASAANAGMMTEDYRALLALTLPHAGPICELPITWRRLVDHAQRLNLGTVRPYWRLNLRRRRMPDGNPLPIAEAAIFLER
jgi:hypothetical protein